MSSSVPGSDATSSPAALIFPIGRYLGTMHRQRGGEDHHQMLQLDATIHAMTDDEILLWAMAHGRPDKIMESPWTRVELLAGAAERELAQPAEEILADLFKRGALVEVTPDAGSMVDFAYRHRMFPLMLGLGNTPEEPTVYSVGFLGRPLVSMSSMVYDLFEWAQLDENLWAACQTSADAARRAGQTAPVETNPDQVLALLVRDLHSLLTVGAVYLDTAPDSHQPSIQPRSASDTRRGSTSDAHR